MPFPLYPRERVPRYSLDRRLGGPHSRSGRCSENKNLPLPGIEPGTSSLWTIATAIALSRVRLRIFTIRFAKMEERRTEDSDFV
jgi:hypothetical protein